MPIGGSGKTGRGLSRTGQPGGKRTGQRMGHYIEDGGDFERSAKALLADGWTVHYVAVSDPPKIGSEMQVHVRRSPGGGRGMWEQVWETRLEVRAGSYGVRFLFPIHLLQDLLSSMPQPSTTTFYDRIKVVFNCLDPKSLAKPC